MNKKKNTEHILRDFRFRNGLFEDSGRLGYDPVAMVEWFPTFTRRFFRKVRKYLPEDIA